MDLLILYAMGSCTTAPRYTTSSSSLALIIPKWPLSIETWGRVGKVRERMNMREGQSEVALKKRLQH